ncbi:hypothetical protein GJ496_005265 [Pomphorhynchus laevis]|nr:hypothetical protein GJ496_005265 [Pomphorhynchus laevis]
MNLLTGIKSLCSIYHTDEEFCKSLLDIYFEEMKNSSSDEVSISGFETLTSVVYKHFAEDRTNSVLPYLLKLQINDSQVNDLFTFFASLCDYKCDFVQPSFIKEASNLLCPIKGLSIRDSRILHLHQSVNTKSNILPTDILRSCDIIDLNSKPYVHKSFIKEKIALSRTIRSMEHEVIPPNHDDAFTMKSFGNLLVQLKSKSGDMYYPRILQESEFIQSAKLCCAGIQINILSRHDKENIPFIIRNYLDYPSSEEYSSDIRECCTLMRLIDSFIKSLLYPYWIKSCLRHARAIALKYLFNYTCTGLITLSECLKNHLQTLRFVNAMLDDLRELEKNDAVDTFFAAVIVLAHISFSQNLNCYTAFKPSVLYNEISQFLIHRAWNICDRVIEYHLDEVDDIHLTKNSLESSSKYKGFIERINYLLRTLKKIRHLENVSKLANFQFDSSICNVFTKDRVISCRPIYSSFNHNDTILLNAQTQIQYFLNNDTRDDVDSTLDSILDFLSICPIAPNLRKYWTKIGNCLLNEFLYKYIYQSR